MDTLRRHAGITSLAVGAVGLLAAIFLSPGGDLVAVTVLELIAVLVAIGTYVVLRRTRAPVDR